MYASSSIHMHMVTHVWPHMVAHSHTWSHMVTHGHTWSHMVAHGRTWSHMVTHGRTWSHMYASSSIHMHVVRHGRTWSHMVTHVCFLEDSHAHSPACACKLIYTSMQRHSRTDAAHSCMHACVRQSTGACTFPCNALWTLTLKP